MEHRNALLEEEIATLRANPDTTTSISAASQVAELTLALRKLSDKLTLTEEALLSRTHELTNAKGDLGRLHLEIDGAYALVAEARVREEQGSERERDLERRLQAAEEERKMADLVVQEYADLVRTLEGRKKSISSVTSSTEASGRNDSSSTLVDSLAEGRYGLQKLLEEHNIETERLAQEKFKLQGEIVILSSNLEVERQGAEHDREQLAIALHDLEKYRIDDSTAAKMVSRYMLATFTAVSYVFRFNTQKYRKFSQTSTDSLQKAMESQKLRHAATIVTMSAEIASLQKTLSFERQQTVRLRNALDELSEDISREAYGRRREISLRLALLAREERLAESLSRWMRKAKESFVLVDSTSSNPDDLLKLRETFDKIISGAETILQTLDGESPPDNASSGSIARVIAAQDAVSKLTREMQVELDRRLALTRELSLLHTESSSPPASDLEKSPLDVFKAKSVSPVEKEASSQALSYPGSPERVDIPVSPSECEAPERVAEYQSQGQSPAEVPTPPPIAVIPSSEPEVSRLLQTDLVVQSTNHTLDINDTPSPSSAVPVLPDIETTKPEAAEHADMHQVSDLEVNTIDSSSTEEMKTTFTLDETADLSQGPVTNSISFPTAKSDAYFTDQILDQTTLVEQHITPSSSSQTHSSSISRDAPLQQSHPILTELRNTKRRYDVTQRGFRDCHIALKDLNEAIMELPPSDASVTIQKAVERLDDFNEDARVELEIRIADEERLVAGYEALLSIPGAISDEINGNDLDSQIQAFVDGTDPTVSKNVQQFASKLDDLQHDIACIKMVVHEASAAENSTQPFNANSSKAPAGWSVWTAGLLTPPRPVSPGPTFGSVMTSPRLRHSSSFTRTRKQSIDSLNLGSGPLANLGLRISMPSHVIPTVLPTARHPSSGLDPRPRTTSGMHMLGLGKRSTSFGYNITPTKSPSVRMPSMSSGPLIQSDDEKEDGDLASDVE